MEIAHGISTKDLSLPFAPERLAGLVNEAAQIVRHIVSTQQLEVNVKSDGSFVTNADLAVHDFLKQTLPSLVDALVVSEEEIPELETRKSSKLIWLIDPLDNTQGLVEGQLENCAINIMLMRDGIPILGMAYYFSDNRGLLAIEGQGGFVTSGDQIEPLASTEPGSPTRFIAYRDQLDAMAEATREIHQKVAPEGPLLVARDLLPLRLRAIMEGRGDVYIEPRSINEWDVAPAFAMMRALGGTAIGLDDGMPITFNTRELKVKPFILVRPGVDIAQIMEKLSKK